MVRTQIQLTERQHALLKRIAREEGLSMAEIIRTALEYFESSRAGRVSSETWERARSVVGKFRSDVSDGSARHDEYFVDSIR